MLLCVVISSLCVIVEGLCYACIMVVFCVRGIIQYLFFFVGFAGDLLEDKDFSAKV